jgi:hypothetical protein
MQQPNFNDGDRVLAPWEPDWFYPGVIRSLQGPKAFIQFDDGDSGEVPASELRGLAINTGDRVQSRWNQGPKAYLPATVTAVLGEKLQLLYDDGRTEWTTISFVRVPRSANQMAPWGTSTFREGDRVLAPWEPSWFYPGILRTIDGDTAFIKFDDGDRALVPMADLMPLQLEAGARVFARWNQGPKTYAPATLVAINGEIIDIRYDDGRAERTTVSFIRIPRGTDRIVLD